MGPGRGGTADLGAAPVRLDRGRLFALYVAAYTLGRARIDALHVDHANHLLGLRLNDWTSMIMFTAAITYLRWGPGTATPAQHPPAEADHPQDRVTCPNSQRVPHG